MQHPNEEVEASDLVEKPVWYEEGSEVYSVEFCEDPPLDSGEPPTHRWRVLVPGKLNMRATNILDRDIFNDDENTAEFLSSRTRAFPKLAAVV
jgi:hypothetical protein